MMSDNAASIASNANAIDEGMCLTQVRLLATCRAIFQMSRICMGPLSVEMSSEYSYTAEQKGQILSAFAGGYALTQVVGGMFADKFGGALILSVGLITSGGALFALPLAADAGVWHIWWLLFAMGFMQGPTYPAQMVTTAGWAKGSLRSYASSLAGAGSTGGSLLALGLTPMLAVRIGWRSTSIFFGVLTLLFGVVWQCLGRRSPVATPAKQALSGDMMARLRRWSSVLLAPTVLVIFVAHSVHNFVRYFLMAWMPTYYDEVLQVSPDSSGVQQMLPEFVGLLTSIGGAKWGKALQDSGTLSARDCRRVFSSLAFCGAATGLAAISQCSTPLVVTAWMCLIFGLHTLQGLGFGANYLEISKHHSGLVTGIGNTVATGASFVAPVFASYVLTLEGASGSSQAWRHLFVAFAASNLLGLALYVPFCSTTPVDEAPEEQVKKAQ